MKFYKIIAFCSSPVTGYLRFRDIFQLYPLDIPKAPKNDIIKEYPFILEYCLNEDGRILHDGELKDVNNILSSLTIQVNFQNQILNLLTAFSKFHFFIPRMHPQWFVRVDGMTEEEINNQTCVAGLNLYQFPKPKDWLPIQEFSKISHNEIPAQKHPEYFQHFDLEGKEPVTFSQFILAALHNYFLLSAEQKTSVDSALELINQAVKLRQTMKSLSFVALITSIETMVAIEYKNHEINKCKLCGQDQYKIMGKFRDYLFEYATSSPDAKKPINELYSLRSKIAHAGMLILGDGKFDLSPNPSGDKQFNMHLEAMMLSKLSLINWILKRGEKENSDKNVN